MDAKTVLHAMIFDCLTGKKDEKYYTPWSQEQLLQLKTLVNEAFSYGYLTGTNERGARPK